jgi:uncharacterized protein
VERGKGRGLKNSKYWIEKLGLIKHPEGGWYREVYKSDELIKKEHLPERFSGGDRHFSTAIYFLLSGGEYSAFHRIKSDETWHFYDGSAVTIHMIDSSGNYSSASLGVDIESGEIPQFTVPHSSWFAAEVTEPDSFALVGCTVSPGFHFDDFEMGERETMINDFKNLENIIVKFTRY